MGIEPAYRLRRFREPPQADFEVALLFVGCPRCERTLDQAIGNFGVVLGQALAPVRRPGLEALLEAGNPFVAERRRVLSLRRIAEGIPTVLAQGDGRGDLVVVAQHHGERRACGTCRAETRLVGVGRPHCSQPVSRRLHYRPCDDRRKIAVQHLEVHAIGWHIVRHQHFLEFAELVVAQAHLLRKFLSHCLSRV